MSGPLPASWAPLFYFFWGVLHPPPPPPPTHPPGGTALTTLVIYLQAKIWQLGLRNAVIQSFFKLALYSFNVAAHNCALRLIISSVCKICIITKLVHNISSILRIVKNKNIFKYFHCHDHKVIKKKIVFSHSFVDFFNFPRWNVFIFCTHEANV